MQDYLQPFLIKTLGAVPVIGALFAGPPLGYGILTAGLILAVMILPFITAISRDVFETVPAVLKEAAYGVGCTTSKSCAMSSFPIRASGHRRRHAGARPRARRDDGGHVRDRQCDENLDLDPCPGDDDFGNDRQSIRRSDEGLFTSSLLALGFILFIITFYRSGRSAPHARALDVKAGR